MITTILVIIAILIAIVMIRDNNNHAKNSTIMTEIPNVWRYHLSAGCRCRPQLHPAHSVLCPADGGGPGWFSWGTFHKDASKQWEVEGFQWDYVIDCWYMYIYVYMYTIYMYMYILCIYIYMHMYAYIHISITTCFHRYKDIYEWLVGCTSKYPQWIERNVCRTSG